MANMKQLSSEDVTMILSGLIKLALATRESEGLAADAVTPAETLSDRISKGTLHIQDADERGKTVA